MKKILSIIATLLILCSCGGGKDSLTIKGKFIHLRDGEFFVYSTHPLWSGFDTVKIAEGKFEYSCTIKDTMVLTLQFPNYMQMFVVGVPGGSISIKGDANHLLAAKINGSNDNELLTNFRSSIIGKTTDEELKLAENFIRKNPSSYASEALLKKYFLDVQNLDYKKSSDMLDSMIKTVPWRVSLRNMKSKYAGILKYRKGKAVPSFTAVTLKGDTVNNKSFQGKPYVVWFWSTWTDEMQFPISNARQKLRPWLKDIRMLNICLDADTIGMIKRMERDSVPGYVVCDRQGWLSPMVSQFGVKNLPAAMLVDEKGIVLERDMGLDALLQALNDKFSH